MGTGGALTLILLTAFIYQTYRGVDISLALIIAGLVCTARLLLGQHNNFEIYAGFITGILCQLIAYWVSV